MDPASIINSLASVRANHLQMQSRIHELEAKILRLSCVQMSHRSEETESTLAALALELDTLRNGEPGTISTDGIAHANMRHVRECWILDYLSAVTYRVMHPISYKTPCHVLTLCLLHPSPDDTSNTTAANISHISTPSLALPPTPAPIQSPLPQPSLPLPSVPARPIPVSRQLFPENSSFSQFPTNSPTLTSLPAPNIAPPNPTPIPGYLAHTHTSRARTRSRSALRGVVTLPWQPSTVPGSHSLPALAQLALARSRAKTASMAAAHVSADVASHARSTAYGPGSPVAEYSGDVGHPEVFASPVRVPVYGPRAQVYDSYNDDAETQYIGSASISGAHFSSPNEQSAHYDPRPSAKFNGYPSAHRNEYPSVDNNNDNYPLQYQYIHAHTRTDINARTTSRSGTHAPSIRRRSRSSSRDISSPRRPSSTRFTTLAEAQADSRGMSFQQMSPSRRMPASHRVTPVSDRW